MKKNKNRLIILIVITSLLSTLFTGCFDRREIDELGFVFALGLDKGKTNFLKLTFQVAKPQGGGGEGGGGGGAEEAATITTVEAPTIYSGINLANAYLSKQINLSHIKAIVLSKELAQQGIEPYLHAFIRGREFRPNMYVVVARDSAEEYIKSIKPEIVLNPAKCLELIYRGASYTGLFSSVQFHEFYKYAEALYRQPVAILGGVSKFKSSKDFNVENSTYKEKNKPYPLDGDYKAGDLPKTGGIETENIGLAVFDGDRMIGELDGKQSTSYLLATGEYDYSYWTIPDPKIKDKFVILNIRQSRRPKRDVQIVDGKPKIDLIVRLEADILSIQSSVDYERLELAQFFETYAEDFIRKELENYLYLTSRNLNSDINGFGQEAKKSFILWNDWENYNWKGKYKDASFNVQVDLKIRRPGLILRSLPSVSTKGKERIAE